MSGPKMSPETFRARLRQWAASDLPAFLEKQLGDASTRIGARAVGTFMRNARGEGLRASTDTGPLRILSGRLAKALRPKGPGAIDRFAVTSLRATLTKGVDLGVVPYARIHELGGNAGRGLRTLIPARPYLRPARDAETPAFRARAQRAFTRSVRAAVRGTPALSDG